MRERRYVRDGGTQRFLSTVLATASSRKISIPRNRYLWRAQLGYTSEPLYEQGQYIDDVPAPYPPERMKPLKNSAREGRANPKGIPYLYLSNRKETAMAEVRPWFGSLISVGQFKTLRKLNVISCLSDQPKKRTFFFREPSVRERRNAVWADIDEAFSRPTTLADDVADYVPTQILAELFKSKGYDGLVYRSTFGGGHNVVLFDLEAAELINCFLYELKRLDFDFQQVANPYFVAKHYEQGGHPGS